MRDDQHRAATTRTVRASSGYLLLILGGTLIMGAALLAVLGRPFDMMMGMAGDMSQTQASATGISWAQQAWDWAPWWIALLGMIMLMAGAVTRSGRR